MDNTDWLENELIYLDELQNKIKDFIKKGSEKTEEDLAMFTQKVKNNVYREVKKISKKIECNLKDQSFEINTKNGITRSKKIIKQLESLTPEKRNKYSQAHFDDYIKMHKNYIARTNHILKKFKDEQQRLVDLKNSLDEIKTVPLQIPPTKYPNAFLIPKDKVSNKLFNGELSKKLTCITTENTINDKKLTAKVSIGFDELDNVNLNNKNITPYDREVHDAIVSLYVDGDNKCITPLMIYRTMTGNKSADLTPKIKKDIINSINKMSTTRITIDAKDEAKAFGMDKIIYEGNLIYTKKIIAKHKGNIGEWIYIMERPVLYDYANSKNQVTRMDIKLLDTPVNKNEETIILQGYLQRRILAMKGTNLSRNILYDTVYKHLNLSAKSKASLRNKKLKIRNTAKTILSFWKDNNFIKDFKENTGPNNSKVSISIKLD